MKKVILSIAVVIAVLIGCKSKGNSDDSKKLNLAFESKSNSNVTGTATYTEKKGMVTFVAKLTGLNPGIHAIRQAY